MERRLGEQLRTERAGHDTARVGLREEQAAHTASRTKLREELGSLQARLERAEQARGSTSLEAAQLQEQLAQVEAAREAASEMVEDQRQHIGRLKQVWPAGGCAGWVWPAVGCVECLGRHVVRGGMFVLGGVKHMVGLEVWVRST